MPMNLDAATGALSFQQYVTYNRDVLVKGNWFVTACTVRCGKENGLLCRQTVYQDVKETPKGCTKESYDKNDECSQGSSSM